MVKSKDPVVVVAAAVTALMLVLAVFDRTHELGATAVFGSGHLWGETGLRVWGADGPLDTVDTLELVQHALFALTIAATVWVWRRRRGLVVVAVLFTGLVLAAHKRTIDVDPELWRDTATPAFWIFVGWTISLYAISLAVWLRGRRAARDAGPVAARVVRD